MTENIQPIRIEDQQSIFRFSIPFTSRITYKSQASDYEPFLWESLNGYDEISDGGKNEFLLQGSPISYYDDPIFRGLPAQAEYIKFRFKSFEIVRGIMLEEVTGAPIPESPAQVGTFYPELITFIFNDKYQISDAGFFTNTNGNIEEDPPDPARPYRYEALMHPSQWYYMSEEDSDFQWTIKMEISNEFVPTFVITNLLLFHQQRLTRFSYEMEVEFKIREVEIQRPIDEQQINMKNLYSMLEQFVGKPKVESKTRDGVNSKMKDQLKGKSKEEKALVRRLQQEQTPTRLPPIELTPEEREFFIEKLLSVLTV